MIFPAIPWRRFQPVDEADDREDPGHDGTARVHSNAYGRDRSVRILFSRSGARDMVLPMRTEIDLPPSPGDKNLELLDLGLAAIASL